MQLSMYRRSNHTIYIYTYNFVRRRYAAMSCKLGAASGSHSPSWYLLHPENTVSQKSVS